MRSADELAETLRTAAQAVEKAGVADDLRQIAFRHALEALAAPSLPPVLSPPDGPPGRPAARVESSSTGLLGTIAARLQLPTDVVESIYEEEGDELRLIVQRSMLPDVSRKAAAMRDVSLLTAVGRQAAGIDEYTSFATMREECLDLKVLDPPNFATEVGKLGFRLQGGRNSRTAKANRHHFEEATDLIRRMIRGAQP